MDSYPSLEGLHREYRYLGTLQKNEKEYNFWLSKTNELNGVARVTTPGVDEIGQNRQLAVVRAEFQPCRRFDIKNAMRVHIAYTHPDYRSEFLTGGLYILLARCGYSIVSDFEQLNGGRTLWKKQGNEADAREYVMRIWSDEIEDWVLGDDGEPLRYNAANLDDDQIWYDISANCEPTTLLVLSSK
jgi:hypothetical protein